MDGTGFVIVIATTLLLCWLMAANHTGRDRIPPLKKLARAAEPDHDAQD